MNRKTALAAYASILLLSFVGTCFQFGKPVEAATNTIPGDCDGDYDVDSADLFMLAAAYGTQNPDQMYNPNCDFDNDGDVDSMDLFTLAGNYGVVKSKTYRGICFPQSSIVTPYTDEDYERVASWGLNAVLYDIWWTAAESRGGIEPLEDQVGYSETNLQGLRTQVNLAKQHNLSVFLSHHISYHRQGVEWSGWSDVLGHDYVNLNQTDASGSYGRTRYLNYLSMMAERFPDCGFVPIAYPYHGQENWGGLTTETVDIYYETTFPQMLSAIRQFNEQPVILSPILMGFGPWWETDYSKRQQTWFYTQDVPDYGDANLLYNINTHDSYNSLAVLNTERWDYDVDKLRWHYQPCFDKPLPYVSIEFLALNIHSGEGAERPIHQSRLDWAVRNMNITNELEASWFYFRYENPALAHSPLEKDGSDSALVLLLRQYAYPPAW